MEFEGTQVNSYYIKGWVSLYEFMKLFIDEFGIDEFKRLHITETFPATISHKYAKIVPSGIKNSGGCIYYYKRTRKIRGAFKITLLDV